MLATINEIYDKKPAQTSSQTDPKSACWIVLCNFANNKLFIMHGKQ